MAVKIGINGFGRIGRLVFRAAAENPNIEIVGMNDIVPPDNLAYLLKYDSTHGRFAGTVEAKEDGIVVNGKHVPCYAIRNPAELPWGKTGADYVVEFDRLVYRLCRRRGTSQSRREARDYIRADQRSGKGADAPDGRERRQVRPSHRQSRFQRKLHDQLSRAGREGDQRQLRPDRRADDDRSRRDRDAADAGRPEQEGLARRPERVPEHHPLQHRRRQGRRPGAPRAQGQADRHGVPRSDGDVSVVDLTFRTAKPTSYKEICAAMKEAREGALKGILGYTDEEVVSSDFIDDRAAASSTPAPASS